MRSSIFTAFNILHQFDWNRLQNYVILHVDISPKYIDFWATSNNLRLNTFYKAKCMHSKDNYSPKEGRLKLTGVTNP